MWSEPHAAWQRDSLRAGGTSLLWESLARAGHDEESRSFAADVLASIQRSDPLYPSTTRVFTRGEIFYRGLRLHEEGP